MTPTDEPAARSVPRATRWFVFGFLFAFFVCAVFRLEAWPLTGFRIFSKPRHEIQRTWVAATVAPGGRESRLWFVDLPRAYQDFYLVMPRFRRLPRAKEQAICQAWLSAARRLRPTAVALRIYRMDRSVLPEPDGRRPPPVWHEVEYACA
jgi:hypothetical protein